MPGFTLYDSPPSSNAKRVRMTMAEGGITDYNVKWVDLMKGGHKSEEYLKINPWGKVPSLTTEDGQSMCESRAICKYLARKYKIPLIPADSDVGGWALFDQAEQVEMLYFGEPASRLGYEKFAKKLLGLTTDEVVVTSSLKAVQSFFDTAEKLLQTQEYMAGSKFSLVDIFYLPNIVRLSECGYGNIVHSHKAVNAWWERCSSRPAIQKSLANDKALMQQMGKPS